ncbi:MAG: triose-phosphate isomerase [Candidatus Pacebacteria bacterium]|jgi:triosephosphate isomerase|nr:triose-phosphate isomerase [Candidatus Paceibacterota bacterium]
MKSTDKKMLVVANWKMNPSRADDAKELFSGTQKIAHKLKHVETVVCPPVVYLAMLGDMVTDRQCVLGAQDTFWEHEGSYTGEVSPDMIFSTKARYIIIGHSERRAQGDTDAIIAKKVHATLQFPLIPIICIGEEKRDEEGLYLKTVRNQIQSVIEGRSREDISRMVFAYEPVWAIGKQAERPCTPEECKDMIALIRREIADVTGSSELAHDISILYGGSVDAENVSEFLTAGDANGVLVGRASLDVKIFGELLKKVEQVS